MGADAHKLTIVGTHARQHVYALDQRTGALRWDTAISATGAEPPFNESAIPMYANGTVYDGSPLGAFVTALDARTGRVKWTLQVGGPVKSGLVTRDGVLYFGDLSGKLWAVDAAHGNAIGSIQTDLKFNVGSPIILNDSLVIGSQEGPIVALPLAAIAHSESVKGVTSASHHILRDILLVVIAILVVLAGLRIVAVSRRRPATRR
jgi:outer membrane protein assembly factor BamB